MDLGHHVEEAVPLYDRESFTEAIRIYLFSGIAFAVTSAAETLGRELSRDSVERLTWLMIEDGR